MVKIQGSGKAKTIVNQDLSSWFDIDIDIDKKEEKTENE
jgi:hypothetical protein